MADQCFEEFLVGGFPGVPAARRRCGKRLNHLDEHVAQQREPLPDLRWWGYPVQHDHVYDADQCMFCGCYRMIPQATSVKPILRDGKQILLAALLTALVAEEITGWEYDTARTWLHRA